MTLFESLHAEFAFTLDAAASAENAKCAQFYAGIEGLLKPWSGRVFLNPPYGRHITPWIRRAALAVPDEADLVVGLLPCRTDTRWWHDWVMKAREIRFLRGRLNFVNGDGVTGRAPFPSAVVIWR